MSLEFLKKLVRLATNNPNEHEANLAARKACDYLVKNDFKAILEVKEQSKTNNFKSAVKINKQDRTIDFSISDRERAYNPKLDKLVTQIIEIIGAPKPPQKPPPENPYSYRYYDEASSINENFVDMFDELFRRRKAKAAQDDPFVRYKPFSGSWDMPGNNELKKLKCTICREEKETRFRGPADIWVCMECRGSEAFRKKK